MPGTTRSSPKVFLVEEASRPQMRVEFLVIGLVEFFGLDSEILQNGLGDRAVLRRTFDRLGAAVTQKQALAHAKLVAPGVAAEVVVIVENENAGISGQPVCGRSKRLPGR